MDQTKIPDIDLDETKDEASDNETVIDVPEVRTRLSSRINKGIPPQRYGDNTEPKARAAKSVPEVARSIKSNQSEIRRRKLQSDLEAKRRIAEIEEKQEVDRQLMRERQLAREKELIEMQRELEHAEIDEEAECSNEDGEVPFDQKLDNLREWVKGLPSSNKTSSVKSEGSGNSAEITPDPVVNMAQTMALAMTDAFKNIALNSSKTDEASSNARLMRKSLAKDLPDFHGRPEEWPIFICTYKRSTEVCQFSEEENMARLQKCLKGEALKAVQILLISPNNATRIVNTLEKLFGQPRHIVSHLISKAKNTPPVKDDKSLIEYSQAVSNLIQTMKMLKYEDHLSNPQLYEELLMKLPPHYRHEWAASLESGKRENLEEFATWVDTVQSRTLRIYTPRPELSENSAKSSKPKRTVLLTTESSSEAPKKACTYCEKTGHQIWNCRSFKSLSVVDRGKFVREKRSCFRCLEVGHISSKCSSKRECGENDCKGKHHRLLHGMPYEKSSKQAQTASNVNYQESENSLEQILCLSSQLNYAVLPIILKGPTGEVSTHAMIDTGSAFTLIDEAVAKSLGLSGTETKLSFRTLNPENQSISSQLVSLKLINPKNKTSFKIENVHTYPNLKLKSGTLKKSQIVKWKHLRDLDLPTYVNANPKILIGLPHADLITTTKCPRNAPVAIETKLGWVIMGDMKAPIEAERPDFILHVENKNSSLHEQVREFFSCEDFGVKLFEGRRYSKDEQRAIDIANQTARKVGDRYEIGLLWARDNISLPESRTSAVKRLKSLEKKMDQNLSYAEKYCKNMLHYMDSGYISKISKEELSKDSDNIWYLPHFGVERENKPGKLRLVFDAASKSHGLSLNDNLLKGPDILKPLPSVLCKFREGKIAITGDIKEMFHQVKMIDRDQNAQRLLWRGMNRTEPPSEYKMQVMTFGASCSPFSAQFIKNKNAELNSKKFPRAAESIINRHYVDDMLDSCESVEEATQLFNDVFTVQKMGGFHVCNWASNSKELMRAIPDELRSKTQKVICKSEDSSECEKVLGLAWQPTEDVFTFSLNFSKVRKEVVDGSEVPTKREALSLIMSIFDPLGFVANLTVKAKILLQKTWRANIDWDDPLPHSIYKIWQDWTAKLQGLPNLQISRCYSPNLMKAENIQLHVFCDASELAYAAVAYFRVEFQGKVEVSFVAAKTRVTPLKPITVPRCELQAALMGARLAKSICEWHSVTPTEKFFWTDSRTVACCLRMDGGTLKTFVSHRITEIQELSSVESWRWIPTDKNVADEATREDSNWTKSSRWLHGPDFLKLTEEFWPKEESSSNEASPEVLEVKKSLVGFASEQLSFPDFKNFSKYTRLLRVTAYILRFYYLLRGKKPESEFLSIPELKRAQVYLVKLSQSQSFSKDIKNLQNGKQVSNVKIVSLSPILNENGILCLKGRVQGTENLGNLVKNPPILDSKHPFTQLLIRHYHETAGHHGQDRVTNQIKERFCIPQLRAAVRKSWSDCQHCKNLRAIPKPPEMSILPQGRLAFYQRPFTHTGVDYFGPMSVTVGRRTEKRYGALFTCLTTRAVHIELAGSLSTDSFIMALRRFVSRRGTPSTMYSDNGTNFVGAHNELNIAIRELNQQQITEELSVKEIDWRFNPPSAPHMGGSWERMVRSIKVALSATLKERNPREETLSTLLVEAECTVNGHPLTYVSGDETSEEVLTPNHFLIGTATSAQPVGLFTDSDLIPGKQWKYAQRLADHFWNRWLREFLPTLTRRQKWSKVEKPLEVGDVVIVMDGTMPRNSWPKGIVTSIPTTKDGQTRWAFVKTALGTYRRPTVKLCILDVKGKSN